MGNWILKFNSEWELLGTGGVMLQNHHKVKQFQI